MHHQQLSAAAPGIEGQAGQKGRLPSLGSLGVWSSAKLSRLPVRRPDHLPSHHSAGPGGHFAPDGQLLVVCSLGHRRVLACCGPLSLAQGHVWNTPIVLRIITPWFWWLLCPHLRLILLFTQLLSVILWILPFQRRQLRLAASSGTS